MQCIDRGNLQNAKWGDGIRRTQLVGQRGNTIHCVGVSDGNTASRNTKGLCHEFRHHRRACTAADQHDCLWGLSIEFEYLFGNCIR